MSAADAALVIDRERFGKRLKSARYDAGFDRMVELANKIEDEFGIPIPASTLYTYEAGRTFPPFETLLLILAVLQPLDGLAYFAVAVRPDIRERVFGSP